LKASGELDVATAPILTEACLSTPGPINLDLSGIVFVDGAGIGALTDLAAARTDLVFTAVSPIVERMIEVSGLGDELTVSG
jgi:anti-anti-sigma factor